MVLEREGCKPIRNPTTERIRSEIRRIRSTGPSSFACLQANNGDYIQVAGSPGGMLVEKREATTGRQFRGSQEVRRFPFPDGTTLSFAGNHIPLRAAEWFTVDQVVEILVAFMNSTSEPAFVQWRQLDL
jgi:hypothetical protein